MKVADLDHWKTKAEAAAILVCSEKTIERLSQAKKIQRAIRRIPGRRPLPVFNPDDIERLKQETMTPEAAPVSPLPGNGSKSLARVSTTKTPDVLASLASALSLSPQRVSPTNKLYLTVPEASEYTGLSETYLRRRIKAGELPALKDRSLKLKRSDLDKL